MILDMSPPLDLRYSVYSCSFGFIFKLTFHCVQNVDSVAGKVLVATSDILTMKEQDEAYVRGTGKHLPAIPDFAGRLLLSKNEATKHV